MPPHDPDANDQLKAQLDALRASLDRPSNPWPSETLVRRLMASGRAGAPYELSITPPGLQKLLDQQSLVLAQLAQRSEGKTDPSLAPAGATECEQGPKAPAVILKDPSILSVLSVNEWDEFQSDVNELARRARRRRYVLPPGPTPVLRDLDNPKRLPEAPAADPKPIGGGSEGAVPKARPGASPTPHGKPDGGNPVSIPDANIAAQEYLRTAKDPNARGCADHIRRTGKGTFSPSRLRKLPAWQDHMTRRNAEKERHRAARGTSVINVVPLSRDMLASRKDSKADDPSDITTEEECAILERKFLEHSRTTDDSKNQYFKMDTDDRKSFLNIWESQLADAKRDKLDLP